MYTNILEYLYNDVKFKDKVALSGVHNKFTFNELKKEIDCIASGLAVRNIYKQPVIVFMERDVTSIACYLGIVRANCYFVPVDVDMSRFQIQSILEQINAKFVICDENTKRIFKGFEYDMEILDYASISKSNIDSNMLDSIFSKIIDSDVAYVLFNGDKDSVAKGAVVSHRHIIESFEQIDKLMKFNKESVFGSFLPLFQDGYIKEILATFKYKASFYLIPKEFFFQPDRLMDYLNLYKINTICWMSSALKQVSASNILETVVPKFINTVAIQEENLSIKHLNKWRSVLPKAKFINLYGVSECVDVSCYYEINRQFSEDEVLPIGKPLVNTEILLVDENNNIVTNGFRGEVCIRSNSVCNGYYKNNNKTSMSFVQNPMNDCFDELVYKTGDIAEYNKTGELVLVGRNDFQVKYMGQRLELAEIENEANKIDDITSCDCCFDSNVSKISLYYQGTLDPSEVKAKLKMVLPYHMRPHQVINVKQMPLTTCGDIDKAHLFTLI